MTTYEALEDQDQAQAPSPPRLFMTMPAYHLMGEGTLGVELETVPDTEDRLVLSVPMPDQRGRLSFFGSRHQLLQFTAELAAAVEIGVLE